MKKTNKKEMEKDLEVKEKDLQEKEINTVVEMFRTEARKGAVLPEKDFTNIKKLKCDYTVYKRERTNCNMPVQTECSRCGKKFEEGDELYIANSNGKDCIICSKCAK